MRMGCTFFLFFAHAVCEKAQKRARDKQRDAGHHFSTDVHLFASESLSKFNKLRARGTMPISLLDIQKQAPRPKGRKSACVVPPSFTSRPSSGGMPLDAVSGAPAQTDSQSLSSAPSKATFRTASSRAAFQPMGCPLCWFAVRTPLLQRGEHIKVIIAWFFLIVNRFFRPASTQADAHTAPCPRSPCGRTHSRLRQSAPDRAHPAARADRARANPKGRNAAPVR